MWSWKLPRHRHWFDFEMGRTVIEVKPSLAAEGALANAATQLAGDVDA